MNGKTRKDQLLELLELDPDDPFPRYGLAMEHASAGEDEKAVEVFRDLLARDSNYVPGYLQLGRALIRLGDDDAAKDVLRQGITTARQQGDEHAAGEMTGFLEQISS